MMNQVARGSIFSSTLVFLLLTIIPGFAQINNDSLEQVLKGNISDSLRIDILSDLGAYYKTVDTSKAIFYANRLLDLGDETGIERAVLHGYNQLGNLAQNAGNYNQAIHYYKTAISQTKDSIQIARLYGGVGASKFYMNEIDSCIYFTELGLRLKQKFDPDETHSIAVSMSNIAQLNVYQNQYEKALEYYHQCQKIWEQTNAQYPLTVLYNNMGIAYRELGNQPKRLEYLDKAYVIAKAIPDYRSIGTSATNLANYYEELDDPEKTETFHVEAINALDQIGQKYNLATALQTYGTFLLNQNRNTEAEAFLTRAIKVAKEIDSKETLIHAYGKMVYIHEYKNDVKSAYNDIQSMLKEAEAYEYIETKSFAYKIAFRFFESHGQMEKALLYHKEYMVAHDSLASSRQNKTVKELQVKYESQEKEAQIAQQQLKIQSSMFQRNLAFYFLAAAVFFGCFLYYLYRKNKILSRTKIENLEHQQKLVALDYMLQGQEVERKRIAQDLHDGLGGLLSTARIQLQNIQKEVDKFNNLSLLDEAEFLINNACTEVRRIAHDMMPSALTDLGLKDAVEDLADVIISKHNINVVITDQSYNLQLSEIQKVQIYRAIQEILQNAIKHSEATILNIDFTVNEESLIISVIDNGIGFEYDKNKNLEGLGIKSIQSRIQYLNGKLKIHSAPTSGTQYKINIPIH